jgi:hypothetical protein
MAPKDGWERLREREDEEEREREEALQAELLKKRLQSGGRSKGDAAGDLAREASLQTSGSSTEKLIELLDRVEPLMEQVNILYSQYFTGVERLPPVERRKQLDQIMNSLALISKPTQVLQFRFKSVQSRFQSFCDQWERKLRDLESGKGPKRISRAK